MKREKLSSRLGFIRFLPAARSVSAMSGNSHLLPDNTEAVLLY